MKKYLLVILFACSGQVFAQSDPAPIYEATLIFPYQDQHVHGSTLVELPNGDLLATWFQGSGERQADDVALMGARLPDGAETWTEPFLMADVPEFPDINPVLFLDPQDRLWLVWYTVLANQWETSLLKYRISTDYEQADGPPVWDWQDVIHVKPGGRTERGIPDDDPFVASIERQLASYDAYLEELGTLNTEAAREQWQAHQDRLLSQARGDDMVRRDGRYPRVRRIGWQTRNQPVFLDDGRMILPLYSDGFDFSLMAITDDGGQTWSFSEPLVGGANIQAAIAEKADGTLVAYMRDNGPPPKRLQISTSTDRGETWSDVRDSEIPNPGAGSDVITLRNGHWLMVNNDTEEGRARLTVSISPDEGQTWPWTRHLEHDERTTEATRSHYPAVIEGQDGMLHVTYSFHHNDRAPAKSIKYARFNVAWVKG